jgi:exopolyphosphatase/guanosine-5'-triphosphate,3'-diphosphate pyrophosphatase
MERVYATLSEYRTRIESLAADKVVGVLTSAVRDAVNGAEFTSVVQERYRINASAISGDEEARLSFLGATSERADDGHDVVVIDIGGGSTEFVVGADRAVSFRVSTQAGVVRQSERHIHHDPPEPDELQAVADEVAELFSAAVPADVRGRVSAGIAVAGTATSCAAIAQKLEPYDPARVHGFRLDAAQCTELLAALSAIPEEQRRQVPGLHPDRAPTIVAGVLLLQAAMRTFGLAEVEVSEHDILRGVALDAAAAR